LNRRLHFKIRKSPEKKNVAIGPETKNCCAGKGQQQFNPPTQPPILPGINQLECEADHAPLSSTEAENVWIFASIYLYNLTGWCLDTWITYL
jgi:hypothetical protein